MHGQWSAVRRIVDGRAPLSVVLRVASVLRTETAAAGPEPAAGQAADLESPTAVQSATRARALLLTDGWHVISAALDDGLHELVKRGSIRAGLIPPLCQLKGCIDALQPADRLILSARSELGHQRQLICTA